MRSQQQGEAKPWVLIVIALIGFVGATLPFFWSELFGSSPKEFKFSITVRSSSDLNPVSNATIQLSVPGATPYSEYTDTQGVATLAVPQEIAGKDGRLVVTADGYVAHDLNLEIRPNQMPSVVRLSKSPEAKNQVVDPFADIDGLYLGEAEGYQFHFCIQRKSNKHVIGSVYFTDDPENTKVYLEGEIEDNFVEFTYRRYEGHPRGPDSGKAVIVASDKDILTGYWVSDNNPSNREDWKLSRLNHACTLSGWVGEFGEID